MSEFLILEAEEAVLKCKFDPASILEELLKAGDEKWQDHLWHSQLYGEVKNDEEDCMVLNAQEGTDLDVLSSTVVRDYFFEYQEKVGPGAEVSAFSPCRFNAYSKGKGMSEHVDHIHTLFPEGTRRGIPTLSMVGVLQDAEEGGEFLLRGKDAKLSAGELIIFPSVFLYPHSVEPVVSGCRISFVSWAW